MTCRDGREFPISDRDDPNWAECEGDERLRCPNNYPFMCSTGVCVPDLDNCQYLGGLLPCHMCVIWSVSEFDTITETDIEGTTTLYNSDTLIEESFPQFASIVFPGGTLEEAKTYRVGAIVYKYPIYF